MWLANYYFIIQGLRSIAAVAAAELNDIVSILEAVSISTRSCIIDLIVAWNNDEIECLVLPGTTTAAGAEG